MSGVAASVVEETLMTEVVVSDGQGSLGAATAPVEEMTGDKMMSPWLVAALEAVLQKSSKSAKAVKEAALLKKLGKDIKVTKEELESDLTVLTLKAYLQWKKVPFSSQSRKPELVNLAFETMNGVPLL